MKRVGFWKSSSEPDLPQPVARDVSWTGRRRFIRALTRIQESDLCRAEHFRGWSTCRICQCHNGSVTLHYGKWHWPSGLLHYVQDHNVMPDKEFINFVMAESIKLKAQAPTGRPAKRPIKTSKGI
jgi:hypothetical protein